MIGKKDLIRNSQNQVSKGNITFWKKVFINDVTIVIKRITMPSIYILGKGGVNNFVTQPHEGLELK